MNVGNLEGIEDRKWHKPKRENEHTFIHIGNDGYIVCSEWGENARQQLTHGVCDPATHRQPPGDGGEGARARRTVLRGRRRQHSPSVIMKTGAPF